MQKETESDTQWRILILDDDDLMRSMYKLVLPTFLPKDEILVSDNGLRSLELLMDHPFDFIITDLNMPWLSGVKMYEMTNEICRSQSIPLPGFVFCSGVGSALRSAAKICKMPTNRVLLKPFNMKVLAAMIAEMKLQRSAWIVQGSSSDERSPFDADTAPSDAGISTPVTAWGNATHESCTREK